VSTACVGSLRWAATRLLLPAGLRSRVRAGEESSGKHSCGNPIQHHQRGGERTLTRCGPVSLARERTQSSSNPTQPLTLQATRRCSSYRPAARMDPGRGPLVWPATTRSQSPSIHPIAESPSDVWTDHRRPEPRRCAAAPTASAAPVWHPRRERDRALPGTRRDTTIRPAGAQEGVGIARALEQRGDHPTTGDRPHHPLRPGHGQSPRRGRTPGRFVTGRPGPITAASARTPSPCSARNRRSSSIRGNPKVSPGAATVPLENSIRYRLPVRDRLPCWTAPPRRRSSRPGRPAILNNNPLRALDHGILARLPGADVTAHLTGGAARSARATAPRGRGHRGALHLYPPVRPNLTIGRTTLSDINITGEADLPAGHGDRRRRERLGAVTNTITVHTVLRLPSDRGSRDPARAHAKIPATPSRARRAGDVCPGLIVGPMSPAARRRQDDDANHLFNFGGLPAVRPSTRSQSCSTAFRPWVKTRHDFSTAALLATDLTAMGNLGGYTMAINDTLLDPRHQNSPGAYPRPDRRSPSRARRATPCLVSASITSIVHALATGAQVV